MKMLKITSEMASVISEYYRLEGRREAARLGKMVWLKPLYLILQAFYGLFKWGWCLELKNFHSSNSYWKALNLKDEFEDSRYNIVDICIAISVSVSWIVTHIEQCASKAPYLSYKKDHYCSMQIYGCELHLKTVYFFPVGDLAYSLSSTV